MSIAWNALRAQIESFTNPFPAAAIAAADAHRAELAPHLVESIARLVDHPEEGGDPDYALHLYAMHILATWRETTAYAPLVRLGHHPADVVEQLLGDTLTESYGRCLAAVCDGDLGLLQGLVEDAVAAPWARNAALDAIMTRVLEGDAARADLIAYLLRLGDTEAARLSQPGVRAQAFELLNSIISVATEIGAVELLERIRGWYTAGLADAMIAKLSSVERRIARPYEICRDEMLARGKGYVVSVKAEIGWFSPEAPTPASPKPRPVVAMPPRRGAKPGRNEPCPCGSGKKYKKCCGA